MKPRIGKPCGNELNQPLPCIAGKTICKNGAPFCQGAVGPTSEACNCKDDDCNGKVDDNAYCPPGTQCVNCGCYGKCGGGEFPCPAGHKVRKANAPCGTTVAFSENAFAVEGSPQPLLVIG